MSFKSFIIAALAVFLLAPLSATVLHAQGYEGLMAPDDADKPDAPEPGYAGLIEGAVDEDEGEGEEEPEDLAEDGDAPRMTPKPEGPRMSEQYGVTTARRVQNRLDIENAAMMRRYDANNNGIPDKMEKGRMLTPAAAAALDAPRERISGMLMEEAATKSTIEYFEALIAMAKTDEARDAQVNSAIDQLKKMREGMVARKNIPANIYKFMGVPDSFAKQENEALTKSIQRIDAAVKTLSK